MLRAQVIGSGAPHRMAHQVDSALIDVELLAYHREHRHDVFLARLAHFRGIGDGGAPRITRASSVAWALRRVASGAAGSALAARARGGPGGTPYQPPEL